MKKNKKKPKVKNKGVLAQLRDGKTYAFTEDQKLKFSQANLEKLLFDIENDKIHTII